MKELKELYSFTVTREIKKVVPSLRKNKKGETVESKKTVKSKSKNRVIFMKPSFADVEDAEFFYGQKYNELINAGFLTKAMLNKKIGDIGGQSSKLLEEVANKAVLDNVESAKVIEFYEGQDDLQEDQQKKLLEAKELFISSRKIVQDFETSFRDQFNQTADAKAEQRILEWFIFNFSFYEQESENGDKEIFPLFVGDGYDAKRACYLDLCEDIENMQKQSLVTEKVIFDSSFSKLAMVVNIWYSKMGDDQKSIDAKMKEIFPDE
jgi:hypothetical protein